MSGRIKGPAVHFNIKRYLTPYPLTPLPLHQVIQKLPKIVKESHHEEFGLDGSMRKHLALTHVARPIQKYFGNDSCGAVLPRLAKPGPQRTSQY